MAALPTAGLLDAVKQGSQSLVSPTGPNAGSMGLTPSAGETGAQVQQLTAAAQTGKELSTASGGQARLSAIGEKLASLNNTMSAAALSAQGTAQSAAQTQQAAATTAQAGQQTAALNQQQLNLRDQFNNKVAGMLQQSQEQLQQLTLADNRSKAEQFGTLLRLADDKYVTKLDDAATRARLADASQFKVTLAATVFDQETQLLGNNLQFRNLLQQEHRQAIASVANMDLDFAMAMATAENKAAAGAQMWSGVGSVVGAGVAAYAGSGTAPTASTETGPEGNLVMQNAPAPAEQQPTDYGGTYTPYVAPTQTGAGQDVFTQAPNAPAGG